MGGVSIYYIESREGYKYFWYSNTIWCLVVLQYGGHDSWQGQGAAIECMRQSHLLPGFLSKPAFQSVCLKRFEV